MWPENCSGWPEHRQKERERERKKERGKYRQWLTLTFDDLWDFLEINENVTVNYKGRKGNVFCFKARFRCYK